MRVVRCAGGRLLHSGNAEGFDQFESILMKKRRRKPWRLSRRCPGEIGGKGVGAGFGRAESRDPALREQRKRALGMGRKEYCERFPGQDFLLFLFTLNFFFNIKNRLDRQLRMELRRGTDRGEDGV